MTFELSESQITVRDAARRLAAQVAGQAGGIDASTTVPADRVAEAAPLVGADPLTMMVALEELAAASAAFALAAVAPAAEERLQLSGLRGAPDVARVPHVQLVLTAVTLGIGRAALTTALEALKAHAPGNAQEVDKPHWVVADAATELDAARLLAYQAAQTGAEADVAVARLMATAAADRAVAAALRIVGAEGVEPGARLERLARDARAIAFVLGGEEQQRAVAAGGLLPSS